MVESEMIHCSRPVVTTEQATRESQTAQISRPRYDSVVRAAWAPGVGQGPVRMTQA
jgi:hypothetical protein